MDRDAAASSASEKQAILTRHSTLLQWWVDESLAARSWHGYPLSNEKLPMKRTRRLTLITFTATLLAILLVPLAVLNAAEKKPLLWAVYYAWYETATGPHGRWSHWSDDKSANLNPKPKSKAQPLIGYYDSDDPGVVARADSGWRRRPASTRSSHLGGEMPTSAVRRSRKPSCLSPQRNISKLPCAVSWRSSIRT